MRPKSDPIVEALRAQLGETNVLAGLTERLARAHDASIYRLVPRVVVRPRDIADIRAILTVCREHEIGVTFRAAGTSLSGQAVSEGVLAELTAHWRQAQVLENGRLIRSQPGVVGGRLNQMLAPLHRRIGPDPASIASAMIGGIVANNASGMCCGTSENSYQTLAGLKIVLADGYYLDTAASDAAERFQRERPRLHQGLAELRERIHASPELLAKIKRKYRLKNTMGYALNAFVDFERPLDILAHLLVGSEGTLGFLAEVTLHTVKESRHKATALAYFEELTEAGAAVEPLAALGANVLELLDRNSMLALQTEMNYPFALAPRCAALLVEFHEDDPAAIAVKLEACRVMLGRYRLLASVDFTEDATKRAHYWKLRKGLFPKVGGERAIGTAVIIEDICLPRARLAEAVVDLRALFERHGFGDAVIFGHAKDGNLHFVLCNDFGDEASVSRYSALMDELAELVVKRYEGSLKAEHGTGRNMAPFVRMEWGEELYEVMRAVKALLDPHGILNPGVLLTSDPRSHLKNLKAMPAVADRVDRCIECGFCERVCPSRDLTLTPRQRIALQREIAGLSGRREARELARTLRREYEYAGVQTCAGDGMCATVCPVHIDTGAYMRELKAAAHSGFAQRVAEVLAGHFSFLAAVARFGLRIVNVLARVGIRLPVIPKPIPLPRVAPRATRGVSSIDFEKPRVVLFSACLTRVMESPARGSADAPREALALGGFEVIPAVAGVACCGQPFQSKGFPKAATKAAAELIDDLWRSSQGGEHPIVCDTSPCTARLLKLGDELPAESAARWRKLRIYDFPSFVAKHLLPRRETWPKISRPVVLHPTCSTMKADGTAELVAVAKAFAIDVTVPLAAGCCGFAGDKGFQVPELTASATREESAEVRTLVDEKGENLVAYSTCQTCALGMSAATGLAYGSIAELCVEALRGGVTERTNFSNGN